MLEKTKEMNEFVCSKLNSIGIVCINDQEYSSLKIERDSMINACMAGEDESYKKTIDLIRHFLYDDLYTAMWESKDDDFYYLGIYKLKG